MSEVHYRDAGTGQFVTEEYALAHPDTTVKETEEAPPATVGGTTEEEA